jgi:hypothetical protein
MLLRGFKTPYLAEREERDGVKVAEVGVCTRVAYSLPHHP